MTKEQLLTASGNELKGLLLGDGQPCKWASTGDCNGCQDCWANMAGFYTINGIKLTKDEYFAIERKLLNA